MKKVPLETRIEVDLYERADGDEPLMLVNQVGQMTHHETGTEIDVSMAIAGGTIWKLTSPDRVIVLDISELLSAAAMELVREEITDG